MPHYAERYPFLAGGGEAAHIIASFDWASTSIGRMESWPASQRSAISFILRSPVPIVTLWGEEGIMIYNDGYSGFAGGRHPALFGSKVREGWPEVADFNDHVMKVVLGRGETIAYRDQELILSRNGVPERVYLNLEDILAGIAGQAATAIDNARLFQAVERELGERKRAEAALQALNATLEQRVLEEVQERSKAEEQLRQMQKMEAVGQLTGGIAHDFNNMLAVIIGGLNLLQRKLAKGETDVGRFVEGATDAAQRAASLTQRLLAFSRQQPLAPETINANRMVSDMSELLVRTLGETISVQTVLAAGLWQIKADPGQLENAILNLSVNARDAMPSGGKLTIETSNAFVDDAFAREFAIPTGQYVLIAVADSGTGMTPEVSAKAFDPFYTTKGVGKGTGLGLSQVYGFVRQSGGHVKIYSEMGVGTTVKIYLPRHYGEAVKQEPMEDSTTLHRGMPSEVVMVVEDEDRVRAVSVESLRELGYTVLEVSGPREALKLFDAGERVALLFTDVVMPDMSGGELADQARKRQPGLKVLYTTGYTRNAIVHNGILDPGTSLLTKPFNINDLALKIRRLLDE